MSTGSVNPITPCGPTQLISVTTTSQVVSFGACDALWILNDNSSPMFVAFGTATQTVTATVPGASPGSMAIPPNTGVVVGIPGVTGFDSQPISQIAVILGTGTGDMYITPVRGTQH